MDGKKSGLSKNVSSIFEGIPNLKEDSSASAGPPVSANPKGRNSIIPIEQSFCRYWGKGGLISPNYQSVLDIGSSALKWICVERTKRENPKILGLAYIPIPVFQDRKKFWDFITQAVRQIRSQAPLIQFCNLVISDPPASFLSLSIAEGNRSRIQQIVESEMMRRNPNWKADQYIASYYVSPRPSREKPGALHVTAGSFERSEIEGWVEAIENGGWEVRHLSALPFAIEKLVQQARLSGSDEVVGVLDVGATHTLMLFYRGGILEYQRKIPFSIEDVTKALQRPIIGTQGKIELTREEADEIRVNIGVPSGEGEAKTTLGKVIYFSQILGLVRLPLERFVREIEGSINFYLRTYQLSVCRKVFLTGGGVQLPNLIGFIKDNLKIDKIENVEPFGLLQMEVPDPELRKWGFVFTPVAAQTLVGPEKIDFRPLKIRWVHALTFGRKVVRWAASLVLGISLILYVFDSFHLRAVNQSVQKLYGGFLTGKSAMTRIEFLQQKQSQLLNAQAFYKNVVGFYPPWDYLLREVSVSLSDQIFLDEMKVTQEQGVWVLMMGGHVLPGKVSVDQALGDFLVKIEDTRCVWNTQLSSSVRLGETEKEGIRFELKGDVNLGEDRNA